MQEDVVQVCQYEVGCELSLLSVAESLMTILPPCPELTVKTMIATRFPTPNSLTRGLKSARRPMTAGFVELKDVGSPDNPQLWLGATFVTV